MGNLKIGWLATGVLAVAVVVVAVLVYARFRRDIRAAQERLQSGGSQVIETDCGSIEYGNAGNGPPVLVIHRAGGGYDQGLLIGSQMFGEDFKLIAPSRFGYLNSPIPEDSSLEAQAIHMVAYSGYTSCSTILTHSTDMLSVVQPFITTTGLR